MSLAQVAPGAYTGNGTAFDWINVTYFDVLQGYKNISGKIVPVS